MVDVSPLPDETRNLLLALRARLQYLLAEQRRTLAFVADLSPQLGEDSTEGTSPFNDSDGMFGRQTEVAEAIQDLSVALATRFPFAAIGLRDEHSRWRKQFPFPRSLDDAKEAATYLETRCWIALDLIKSAVDSIDAARKEFVTLAEVAKLANLELKTIQNKMSCARATPNSPPDPIMRSRGSIPALYSYRDLRAWLLSNLPDSAFLFPEDYAAVRRQLDA